MFPSKSFLAILCFLFLRSLSAQTILEGALASSQQDDQAIRFSIHQQLSPKFNGGLQVLFGSPNYRFIAAKPIIDEGYALEVSAPMQYLLATEEKIRLFAFLSPGLRFQGVIDPDGNDQRDSLLNSTAVLIEPGLLLQIHSTDRLSFQSGITFPMAFEISPTNLFENQTTLIHAGLSYQTGLRSQVFLRSNMGAAFGASGDSQKFQWSVAAGGRFVLGKETEKMESLSAPATARKIGWFISPEVGGILHNDHLGKTVGASLGISVWKHRLKIGIHSYGRSGPINGKTFQIEASDGQVYKGSSTLTLRADHGAFGLLLAPSFQLGNWEMDVPLMLGMVGGGFYLFGADRETPDGRRVSEWENQLMGEEDAGFGNLIEFGLRAFAPLKTKGISLGAGLHYTLTPGWTSYYDPSGDFYNNKLRFSLVLHFAGK